MTQEVTLRGKEASYLGSRKQRASMSNSMSTSVELMLLTIEEFRQCQQMSSVKGQAVNVLGFHRKISVAALLL